LGQLKNVSIKIPLIKLSKKIPIYTKTVRDLCLKKPGRKRKDPQTVHILGNLTDIMLGNITVSKYTDPGSPVVDVKINGSLIKNTLIYLGATINVMTKETMHLLQLPNLRPTPTILQLVDRSTVKTEGIIEDIVIEIDSWEYPSDFIVLQPKVNLAGYPLILGKPWLEIVDAFIGCRSGNMIISNGTITKKLVLYPPAQPHDNLEQVMWPTLEEEDNYSL